MQVPGCSGHQEQPHRLHVGPEHLQVHRGTLSQVQGSPEELQEEPEGVDGVRQLSPLEERVFPGI